MSGITRREIVLSGALGAVAALSAPRRGPQPVVELRTVAGDSSGMTTIASRDEFPSIDPTGASDSSAGLQAALDATVSGGTVIVPPGTYLIGSPLAPKQGKS